VTAKQSAVKRYVVKLSDEERERLDALVHIGKHPARLLTKARILLKADASEAGEGWKRRPDCRSPRYLYRYGRQDPPATGGRRV
jgi:hypothetical protein